MSLLHSVLDRDEWSLEDIKDALEQDPIAVDDLNEMEVTPLMRVLGSEKGCSVEVVNLLIHYGADVNKLNNYGFVHMPILFLALYHCKDIAIIKALIKAGADLGVQFFHSETRYSGSVLCWAFRVASMDVIQLLVDSGCPLDDCDFHRSALHCALLPNEGFILNYSMMDYLFSKGLDVNVVDRDGHSLLCKILSCKYKPTLEDVEMLAKQGVSLSSCPLHGSSLFCAASGRDITESIIRRLLEAGANPYDVDSSGRTPLHIIMGTWSEIGAISLLLDLPDVDINRRENIKHQTLLHIAASNQSNRMSSIVQVLLNRGAKVDAIDKNRNTPLHCALVNHVKDVTIIVKLLLESGAPINARDILNATPLMLAMRHTKTFDVLMALFLAGAHFSEIKEYGRQYQVNAFHEMNVSELKLANMFFLLENHDVLDRIENRGETNFMTECVHEIQKMKLKNVNNGFTMLQFVSGGSSLETDENPQSKIYYIDQLLQLKPHLEFPNFFNIIVGRIGRPAMDEKLKKMRIFAVKQHNDLSNMEKHVVLDSDCTSMIAYYLTDVQLLSLILAFYNPCSRNDNRVTTCAGKRYSEQSDESNKCLRLSH